MANIIIKKISSEVLPENFNCGNSSINALVSESYYPTILQHAYAYQISSENVVLGYYMLKFLKIKLEECPEEISEHYSDFCQDCFSVHVSYIAVDSRYQKKGIGTIIIKHIVSSVMELCESWPVRLITLDALKERYEWYCDLGFCAFNEEDRDNTEPTIKMYWDCLLDPEAVYNYENDV